MTLSPNEHQRRRRHAERQRLKRERIRAIRDVATKIRQGSTCEAILLAMQGVAPPQAGDVATPEENVAASLWDALECIASLASDPTVPASVKLSFAETFMHIASVAELRLIEEERLIDVRNSKVTIREILEADRARAIAGIRELIRTGVISLDEVDPPAGGTVDELD